MRSASQFTKKIQMHNAKAKISLQFFLTIINCKNPVTKKLNQLKKHQQIKQRQKLLIALNID